jgi:hypothetical protein
VIHKKAQRVRRGCLAVLAGVVALLCLPASGLAHSGDFAKFNQCPSTNKEVFKCLYSVTSSGEIILGKKKTPIVNPVTLQGGFSKQEGTEAEGFPSRFFAASNGETLSKTAEPVPGGLLGIVPPESSPPLVKTLSKWFFENSVTGVNATLELAKPASEIRISEFNLELEEGVALKLPVRVHLENPFLGSSCYVGSSSSPLIWNLTTGVTAPPKPNSPISGKAGFLVSKDELEIIEITENKLVENAWSAPEATGCGGIISFLVDPIINSQLGLPAAAGNNTAELNNTLDVATAESVNGH